MTHWSGGGRWSFTVAELSALEPRQFEQVVAKVRAVADSPVEGTMCAFAVWYLWAFAHYFRPDVTIAGQVAVGGFRLDLAIVDGCTRLDFECDGHRFHGSAAAFARDRARDRQVSRLGWTPVRFAAGELLSTGFPERAHAICGEIRRRLAAR